MILSDEMLDKKIEETYQLLQKTNMKLARRSLQGKLTRLVNERFKRTQA